MKILATLMSVTFIVLVVSGCSGSSLPATLSMNPAEFNLPAINAGTVIADLNNILNSDENMDKTNNKNEGDANSSGKTHVIIDDTYSIRGHLPDVSGSRSYVDFMDAMFDSVSDASFFTIKRGVEQEQSDLQLLRNNIVNPEFYPYTRGVYSAIYSYLEQFLDIHKDRDGTNLYIILTDMYISGEDYGPNVRESFINLLNDKFLTGDHARNTTIGLIGVMLDFRYDHMDVPLLDITPDGTFAPIMPSVENGQAMPFVKAEYVNNGLPVKRPYYAIVMGNTEKVVDFIDNMELKCRQLPHLVLETAILSSYHREYIDAMPTEKLIKTEIDHGTDETPSELDFRIISLEESGVLSDFAVSSRRENDLISDLNNYTNVININDPSKLENVRVMIPVTQGEFISANAIPYYLNDDHNLEEDVIIDNKEDAAHDTANNISSDIQSLYPLIDFGETVINDNNESENNEDVKGIRYRVFKIDNKLIKNLKYDNPIFILIVFDTIVPIEKIYGVHYELPTWISEWQLDLNLYRKEAYRLGSSGRWEFMLSRTHLGGYEYTQYNRTPFIYDVFYSLNENRNRYILQTVLEDGKNLRTYRTEQISPLGIVRRSDYAYYVKETFNVRDRYLREIYTSDGRFAFKRELSPPKPQEDNPETTIAVQN